MASEPRVSNVEFPPFASIRKTGPVAGIRTIKGVIGLVVVKPMPTFVVVQRSEPVGPQAVQSPNAATTVKKQVTIQTAMSLPGEHADWRMAVPPLRCLLKTFNRGPYYRRISFAAMLRLVKRALRRRYPRRLHPLLDAPIEFREADHAFSAAYAAAIADDPDASLPFIRERYREGIRWRQVVAALASSPPQRVLDLGAGNGAVALA